MAPLICGGLIVLIYLIKIKELFFIKIIVYKKLRGIYGT